MFRLISIVLALALAGMGEASLMMQGNVSQEWASVGVQGESSVSIPVDIEEETDFDAHFVYPTISSKTDVVIEQQHEDKDSAVVQENADILIEGEDPSQESDELIHLMINGQVDHTVQTHN